MTDGRPGPRTVTREELYALVWETPMSRLALDFGVSGNGMAKACDRLNVPYPPRGYWAKKAAGKAVRTIKLPPQRVGGLTATDIHPTPPKSEPPAAIPQVLDIQRTVARRLSHLTVPEGLAGLHPRVKAWVEEHKLEQRERERDSKRRDKFWFLPLIADLTERDLYRFRVTSAIFEGVELVGGAIEDSPINGKVVFRIDGHQVKCTIVEKMLKSLRPKEAQKDWTAFPRHHHDGLMPSGYLRVSINVFLSDQKPQWVETDSVKIGQLLPEVVGTIMAAGPVLAESRRNNEIRNQQYRDEETRRNETRLQSELDDKRWELFQEYAINWEEKSKLQAFLQELEARLEREGDVVVGDRTLSAWIEWARQRTAGLDPLRDGAASMFEAISKTTRWS